MEFGRPVRDGAPFVDRQCGLGDKSDLAGVDGGRLELLDAFDQVHLARRDSHRAQGLVVPVMADVDDLKSLARSRLHLVVDFGDQGADGIDGDAGHFARGFHHLRRGTVRRQHYRPARRHLGDVVDEDHAECGEALHHHAVVDDLVVAVDRRLEDAHHPGERLDRHLHSGAEASRLG